MNYEKMISKTSNWMFCRNAVGLQWKLCGFSDTFTAVDSQCGIQWLTAI